MLDWLVVFGFVILHTPRVVESAGAVIVAVRSIELGERCVVHLKVSHGGCVVLRLLRAGFGFWFWFRWDFGLCATLFCVSLGNTPFVLLGISRSWLLISPWEHS